MDDWPAWATQRVEIDEWSPSWSQIADGLIADLADLLEPWAAAPLEHVGSTAVRGLPAKPVVDLLAPVRSLVAAEAAVEVGGGGLAPCAARVGSASVAADVRAT